MAKENKEWLERMALWVDEISYRISSTATVGIVDISPPGELSEYIYDEHNMPLLQFVLRTQTVLETYPNATDRDVWKLWKSGIGKDGPTINDTIEKVKIGFGQSREEGMMVSLAILQREISNGLCSRFLEKFSLEVNEAFHSAPLREELLKFINSICKNEEAMTMYKKDDAKNKKFKPASVTTHKKRTVLMAAKKGSYERTNSALNVLEQDIWLRPVSLVSDATSAKGIITPYCMPQKRLHQGLGPVIAHPELNPNIRRSVE
ncbi:DgyrCDS10775 [Dimorphilus gyrociliatus]|uniref:DgyrCDS10775 n=1 Tax=Dimorphilus gyrociliatus TaxID=2664684 RepID=A0A7I8W185_9ANNE|nr:DgyrCDS10775 [Dimorphilus gyrociliatus]